MYKYYIKCYIQIYKYNIAIIIAIIIILLSK